MPVSTFDYNRDYHQGGYSTARYAGLQGTVVGTGNFISTHQNVSGMGQVGQLPEYTSGFWGVASFLPLILMVWWLDTEHKKARKRS